MSKFPFLFLLLCCLAVQANSKESASVILPAIMPYAGTDAAGNYAGILFKTFDLIEQNSPYQFNYSLLSYNRLRKQFASGKYDLTILLKEEGADQIGDPIGIVSHPRMILVSKLDTPVVKSLEDLTGINVGYLSGGNYGQEFNHATNMLKVAIDTNPKALQMLAYERVSYLVASERSIVYAHNQYQTPEQLKLSLVLTTFEASLYVSKKSDNADKLIRDLSGITKKLYFSGKFKEALKDYSLETVMH